ncbi:beta-N-acetylhexosaminidase [Pseudacidovorax intermedius]|uniref:Beta-hexosaminidase n=1 Tax=Pseudacidovorax intermedius TaxID=433924 RepID=A0A370FHY4_9BURK|nr:beta-N-acetylhexosaminidase [Pseudacidovorax intermedius]RDI25941.1 beta-N-acetylhexosaminidase [Pseudacidovorax intermedius]
MTDSPLIIDVAGTALTADDRRRLQHPLVGGCIYFSRNFESRAQITALSAEIQALRPDLLIAVDHEGGRVQRFRTDGFTALPSMRSLGMQWQSGGDGPQRALNAAVALGQVLAAELRACGIGFSFAPVLDLDHADAAAGDAPASRSAVIGNRSFHRDPAVVAALARAVMHGLRDAGMAHCGKHFPGHGFAAADSHVAVPVDPRGLEEILADDAAPYRWLSASLAAVMPAHVVYPAVDARPAGFSSRWLQEVLRQRLGFTGAVISDDLSMEGARHLEGRLLTPAQAALQALKAGCDLALLCNQSLNGGAVLDEFLDAMTQARASGELAPSPEREARRRALLPRGEALGWDALMADPAYRHARALLPATV